MSWRLLWVWLALAVGCSGVAAREVLTLGVLAIRPSAPTSLRWQPLQGYLNSAVPEYEFVVKALDLAELRQAVRLAQVDLVITDPAEYVRMAHVSGLAAPLATLVGSHEGNAVRVLGGAIVAQAARPDIVALADLAGKTVAVVSRDMFAGYQVQAHALKGAGVTPGAVLEVGPAQDDALMAVLKGRADLAFVQAGLLEAMVNEGQVASNTLKIINAQPFAGYPFAASTALYPQWPVLALQHVRDVTAARVAGALLSMPRQGALAQAIGIEGFSVPADYESVRALMRTMRMAPFDAESRVTLIDVWHDHQPLVVVGALSILFVTALALRSMLISRKLRGLNDTLESRIDERTAELARRNDDLADMLNQLHLIRDELVESAKLAALGSMVAGLAHELNTPIGTGLTVATTLAGRAETLKKELQGGLKRSTLDTFVADTTQACDLLVRNLDKTASLVTSFKQVAADQASSQRRKFMLVDNLHELMLTLRSGLKASGCTLTLQAPEVDVELDSYPGPLGQVMTHLIQNSVVHGYTDTAPGEVRVVVSVPVAGAVRIVVADDGVGIASAELARIFEPFFTSRLGKGGSGLGLSIARNLVVATLGGKISVISQPGQGATFTLLIPLAAPQALA